MTAARSEAFERFLRAFVLAGLLLIGASWLITGVAPPAWNLAPFALLYVVMVGTRESAARGHDDAR